MITFLRKCGRTREWFFNVRRDGYYSEIKGEYGYFY